MKIPVISNIIDAVKDLVSEVVVDKDKKNELNLELEKLRDIGNQRVHEQILAQIALNTEEARNGSVFVAGWRPFVGWVCGVGLGAQVILLPLLDRIFKWQMEFDTELLILTMSGMLGIGAMRSYEKVKGVSTNDYRDVPLKAAEVEEDPFPEEAPWTK